MASKIFVLNGPDSSLSPNQYQSITGNKEELLQIGSIGKILNL